jgi:hypothetical protein
MAADDSPNRRGGRIDPLRSSDSAFDPDSRIDQAIAESFPASDPPSWNSGLDRPHSDAQQDTTDDGKPQQ